MEKEMKWENGRQERRKKMGRQATAAMCILVSVGLHYRLLLAP
jgi:hypothetical protein